MISFRNHLLLVEATARNVVAGLRDFYEKINRSVDLRDHWSLEGAGAEGPDFEVDDRDTEIPHSQHVEDLSKLINLHGGEDLQTKDITRQVRDRKSVFGNVQKSTHFSFKDGLFSASGVLHTLEDGTHYFGVVTDRSTRKYGV